jgi:AcrR family transcriptional regulator
MAVEGIAGSGRGRQVEARRNDQAVLDAARLVFAVQGPGAPVSAVAAEAGVGMGTLYRRYASKDELLQHLCQASLEQQIDAAEAALARPGEPWGALTEFMRTCISFRAGAFASFAGTIVVTAEMRATAQHAHRLVERLVGRAKRAGSLRPDVGGVEIHELIELFSRRRSDGDDVHERLVAIALDGLRAPGHEPLPHKALVWELYARRWSRG